MERQSGQAALFVAPISVWANGDLPLFPPAREAEIASCADEKTRRQKTAAWRLLAHALTAFCGKMMQDVAPALTPCGKWLGKDVCFSLSHGGELAAVAVGFRPLGADIQALSSLPAPDSPFWERAATENERRQMALTAEKDKPAAAARCWTRKESAFKITGQGAYVPRLIDTAESGRLYNDFLFAYGGEVYACAVAAESPLTVAVTLLDGVAAVGK